MFGRAFATQSFVSAKELKYCMLLLQSMRTYSIQLCTLTCNIDVGDVDDGYNGSHHVGMVVMMPSLPCPWTRWERRHTSSEDGDALCCTVRLGTLGTKLKTAIFGRPTIWNIYYVRGVINCNSLAKILVLRLGNCIVVHGYSSFFSHERNASWKGKVNWG